MADTSLCSDVTLPPVRNKQRDAERDAKIAALLRDAILGDRDALGELCELFRPAISARCHSHLAAWRLESYAPDLTQDIILELIRTFPTIDPCGGNLHGLIKVISLNTFYEFLKRNKVLTRQVPLPDNDDAEGEEFVPDPLAAVSREAWERDCPSKPLSMANKYFVRRFGRAVTKERKRKAKEKELQSRPGSGNGRRDRRKTPWWEMKRIQKKRAAFAAGVEPTLSAASGEMGG